MQGGDYQFLIVSYALVNNLVEVLKQRAFGFVVLDESHYIKSEKARPCPGGPTALALCAALAHAMESVPVQCLGLRCQTCVLCL